MTEPGGVLTAAAEVETFCRANGWRFCFIGGVAVQRWGMPRFTQDVDITLLAGLNPSAVIVEAVLRRFASRVANAPKLAFERRVILARTADGTDLDFALGALAFEEQSVERASRWQLNGDISLTTCSAEDLIVHKAFAARPRDWSDIEAILARQHGRLNLDLVRQSLMPLLELKEDLASMHTLDSLISRVAQRMRP